MVGICGVLGATDHGAEPLASELLLSGEERRERYESDVISVHVVSHPQFHDTQPATAEDDSLVWIHGDPYGIETESGYQPRTDFSISDARYCASLYDDHGLDFLSGLNGEFSGIVFDRRNGEAHLFTDRTGTHPLFYTETDDSVLFSSRVQSIGLHPSFEPDFDRNSLAEFFSVQKAFGTATLLAGVKKVGPASILTVAEDGSVRSERAYWQPTYRPVDRSPKELAAAVVKTFEQVFEERLRDDLTYGVLLSGGSDSRLVLGSALNCGLSPRTVHLTNWMGRESRTAERVAFAAGVDFEVLRRDADYHATLLETVSRSTNFVGAFDESIASGFVDELSSVDVLLSGYLGDTMFGYYPLYFIKGPLPYYLPFEEKPTSISQFVDRYLDRYPTPAQVPDFLDAPPISSVMNDNIETDGDTVRHHGVEYESLRELQLCEYYPLTNQFASANTDSVRQITGHWSPFFDNRVIDLHLTVPVRHRIRHNTINQAVSQAAPELATIPHATTGVPLDRATRYGPGYLLRLLIGAAKRAVVSERPPAPYLGNGPWIDESEMIRSHEFVDASIRRNRELIEALPFLDGEAIEQCYRDHLAGANNWRELYTLVTLLEAPTTKRIVETHRK